MDAPPGREDAARFIRLARLMKNHGLPVPTVHAADEARGFVLMEDLGHHHLIDFYRNGRIEPLLSSAVDLLHRLQTLPPHELPPYTAERLHDELGIFTTWFVEKTLSATVHGEWESFSAALIRSITSQPTVAVHRDWHCKNLMVRHGDIGIVDFQDALAGPALYDLASLLHDCYQEFDTSIINRQLNRFLERCPFRFDNALDLLNRTALQRQLKAIGIFVRLKLRDGKGSHLGYVEGVLARSAALAAASFPGLAIGGWLASLRQQWPAHCQRLIEGAA
jgi:aminoglycoside/choline kinase family phosphotransferase